MKKIVGYEQEKKAIEELKEMLVNSKRYREYGVRIPRGVLLYGEPGVGKTELAKSFAADGINMVELRASEFCDDDALSALSEAFAYAKSQAPSVLVIDELDKIAGENDSFFMSNNDKVRKMLISEMDALDGSDDILVVATCNGLDPLGDVMTRPGRFDRIIKIDLPDEETRKQILIHYFNKIKAKKCFDFDAAAHRIAGFTCAKIECMANECGIIAMAKNEMSISEDDIRIVINKLEFGAYEQNPFDNGDMLNAVAVHEAGHSIIAMLFCPDSIYNASIMPQGESAGHTSFVSSNIIKGKSNLENEVMVLLAGHVAERIALGEYICGSFRDVSIASKIIGTMLTREAMYGYEYISSCKYDGFSDEMADKTQKKLAEILSSLDKRVEDAIRGHWNLFNAIVDNLKKRHVLSQKDLMEIKAAA